MENHGGDADDHGSGWFEVKKRHRAGPKLPIQSVGGGSPNKITFNYEKTGNFHREKHSLLSKERRVVVSCAKLGTGIKCSMPEEVKDLACLEEQVVNKQSEICEPSLGRIVLQASGSIEVTVPVGGIETVQEVPEYENMETGVPVDSVSKIKWGDLEDNDLTLHQSLGNLDRVSKTKHADVGDDKNLGKFRDAEKSTSVSGVAAHLHSELLSSGEKEEAFEGKNWKEVNEISSEDLGMHGADRRMILNDAVGSSSEVHRQQCSSNVKSVEPVHNEAVDGSNSSVLLTENCCSSPIEEVGIMMPHPQSPCDIAGDGALVVPEASVGNKVSYAEEGIQDSISIPNQECCPNPLVDASVDKDLHIVEQHGGVGDTSCNPVISGAEDWKGLRDGSVDVELSKSRFMNDLEKGESGESKERFRQRLWCFLFENLNRAADELYLLCELECDVEQMKEAILVLEEATSDFRELKSRVEGFEDINRSPSQLSTDRLLANAKADHRRPHALSWEVRRMTTSPHRAEILSSSLEAFKKIQQERASKHVNSDLPRKSLGRNDVTQNTKEPLVRSRKPVGISDYALGSAIPEKRNVEISRLGRSSLVQNGRMSPQSLSASDHNNAQDGIAASAVGKHKKEPLERVPELEKQVAKRDKVIPESRVDKYPKTVEPVKRHILPVDKEKEKEKKNMASWKSMDAWKEKRNWEYILASSLQSSSRVSHSPGMRRKSVERARGLHDKLMSPERKKKSALDMKREAEEKHARATRIRTELENERVQRLQRTSEKLNRVNEWQAVRSSKLREGMHARHQRGESRHEAYLAQVARRAGDETSKVNEVRFITSLNEENKKLILRQKLQDSELRRAEKLQIIKTKQKEDMAREEAVLERRKLLEAEKLQRLAETQRKKEEAQVRREEERRASSAAREAKAVEQLRRKEVRAKAQQEEAELLAQKLAERLSESEARRKCYLEQIRERASMDFRDQSSPLLRRPLNKEGQGRSVVTNAGEDDQANCIAELGGSGLGFGIASQQHSLKRRIKKIRQRLMALKYEFVEPPAGAESVGIGSKAQVGAARVKIGRWIQDLQRLRQARKEGALSIGLIVGEMIKFLDGKEPELHASRQAGLLDFIAATLPASHTSKPEACQVTIYLLQLLRVVLLLPANRSYFLAQNLLPPIIPMLSAALENYIKIAASLSVPGSGSTTLLSSKTLGNLESIAEVMEGYLWSVMTIMGHVCSDKWQLQMKDGLMELIIAYQVIHRLRDLFSLYDRPQVEGSPFPSPILLSLNLLAILTSTPGIVSSIDWGSYSFKASPTSKFPEDNVAETAGIVNPGDSSMIKTIKTTSGDSKLPVPLPLSEDRPFDGIEKSLYTYDEHGENRSGMSIDLDNIGVALQVCATDTLKESQKAPIGEDTTPCLPLKKGAVELSAETSNNSQKIDDLTVRIKNENGQRVKLKQPLALLVSIIAETGLVSLPSLLTAVLLQANNKLSSEQASYILPANFEEVATGVLKVLNNLALLDITVLQNMLARPDLQMEFFHLMSFFLSHSTNKWKAATDQVGLLLLETLSLLSYFALFHPGNQAVLRWGKSPTILHKVCDLPFVFFSDPELMPILAGTLVAACYGCEQNRGVVQLELSTEMLLSLLKSCRQGLVAVQSDSSPDNGFADDPTDLNQSNPEPKKAQGEIAMRSTRIPKTTRAVSNKGSYVSGNGKVGKARTVGNHRETKGTKTCEEWALKHSLPIPEASSSFLLHSRFPIGFMDRAEEFFSSELTSV